VHATAQRASRRGPAGQRDAGIITQPSDDRAKERARVVVPVEIVVVSLY
jgi:hypothetical protein